MRMKGCFLVLLILSVPAVAASRPTASTVQSWTPVGVSSEWFESHPAFDPVNGGLYFVRSSKTFPDGAS